MVHIDNKTYAEIAEAAIESILNNGRMPEEIKIAGITLCLDARISEDCETRCTGVEFMGARETYCFTDYSVSDITADAYDAEDEEVETDFNPALLNLDYSDDYARVAA